MNRLPPVRVAIAGVGNCASSLVQAATHYADCPVASGAMFPRIGGLGPQDMEFVAAFDVDARKVGHPLGEAIYALPNCAFTIRLDVPPGPIVQMAPVLDGVAPHMAHGDAARRFMVHDTAIPCDVAAVLRAARADVLVCYMPVGSERAVQFYAKAALDAGCGFVNCVPVFIATSAEWRTRFANARLPLIGDDIKSQFGATILHRAVLRLADMRGLRVLRTYQLNTGGNTDFRNMLDHTRLASKKLSKTGSAMSQVGEAGRRMAPDDVHIGPSDYVPWQNDTKVAFIRVEAEGIGGAPVELEMRLRVEDSPNSAGVVLDAVRFCAVAKRLGVGGAIEPVCAWLMKSPPFQRTDEDAYDLASRIATEPGVLLGERMTLAAAALSDIPA